MAGAARHAAGRAGAAARRAPAIRAPRFSRVAPCAEHAPNSRACGRRPPNIGVTLSSIRRGVRRGARRWAAVTRSCSTCRSFDRHGDAPDLGRVIADFTTLLLVRCDLRADEHATDAVRAFQQRLHGAIAQAAYPALDVLRCCAHRAPRAAPS